MKFLVLMNPLLVMLSGCNFHTSCESCAGSNFGTKICRWCMATEECISSKYLCDAPQSIIERANCPIGNYSSFNETFARTEVIYYVLAANRQNNSASDSDVQSCLNKIRPGIERVCYSTASVINQDSAAYVAVDHKSKRIVVCFRPTCAVKQFFTQGFIFVLGARAQFSSSLNASVNRYYHQHFEGLLNNGLEMCVNETLAEYPKYEVLTCGHSLGGVLANMMSLRIVDTYNRSVIEYTMSAPRSGDQNYAAAHNLKVPQSFRIIRNRDWVPDYPFRISEHFNLHLHTAQEIYYPYYMEPGSYKKCVQPDSDDCNKGSWLRTHFAHERVFDMKMTAIRDPGPCE